MVSVTLPQAFRVVIPPLTNEFVALLKDTSLIQVIGFAVGERELTAYASDQLNAYSSPSPLMASAVLYLVITLPLTRLVAWLESRLSKGRR
jgi:polar amino acid transport system permease protein